MSTRKGIRVLIAEDSELFARAIWDMLEDDPRFVMVGIAPDGRQAVNMTKALRPDVVLMDVRMPVMDGLMAVEIIMDEQPTPILVLTSDPRGRSTGTLSFDALRRGALELLPKP